VRLSEGWHLPGLDLLGPLRQALPPEAIVVADVTRAAYLMMTSFPIYQPRTFLHPAGYVSMGYAIPAALGARAVFPQRPIVVVVGDGGFMMSGMELATAVQENLPIVVVLINDACLTLIKAIQKRRYQERYLGVDLRNPDFALFAQAFGVPHWLARTTEEFAGALREALVSGTTALLEVRPGDARG
jgi:acetolactate synthase-1/2/3 large subunit